LVTFSKSYARKQKWVFFSEHSVLDALFETNYVAKLPLLHEIFAAASVS